MDLLWEAIRDAAGLIARADAELLRIAMLSLAVSASATGLAAALGIPLGIALHIGHFRGRATASLAINATGGQAFADFLVAPDTQQVIANFGRDKFGQSLFVPDAGNSESDLGL